jgi:hypothetical protein
MSKWLVGGGVTARFVRFCHKGKTCPLSSGLVDNDENKLGISASRRVSDTLCRWRIYGLPASH